MMIKIQRRPRADLSLLPDTIHPILKRIYINRGIQSINQLETTTKALCSYKELPGIHKAVRLLFLAIQENKRIIVVGDFDVDGATSSALSVLALRMLGSRNVDYLIPNRFKDGYGLSVQVVDQAIKLGADIIMTVDNGISSIDGVSYANKKGLQVLITDHHLPGHRLPNVDAIVNPNICSSGVFLKTLSGVGVVFYLMMALCVYMRDKDWFILNNMLEPKLMKFLDLVAFGTIADVVPLDKNNRILVYQGLQRIRAGKTRPGIQALIEVANLNRKNLVASDFGFALGPRINAAGRLHDMSFGVELLISDDIHTARYIAKQLNALNQTRKKIEENMRKEAIAFCNKIQLNKNSQFPFGLVLYQRGWHQGIIGILASRMKEKFHRPVVVFSNNTKGILKGSCRSIPGFHFFNVLDNINSQNPGLIIMYGGHSMAAGLTLKEEHLDNFAKIFDQAVRKELGDLVLKNIILSDGKLKEKDFSIHTAKLLKFASPWGEGFPEPVFDGKFKVINQKLVGKKHIRLLLEPIFKDCFNRTIIDGIMFNADLNYWPNSSVKFVQLVYRLDVNEFSGSHSLQLIIEHIETIVF
ncbi:single-stranded-DNA-specific exonuclease RecJ [Candidatus Photodesmus katoptron Akat1]|uniref:Single-stranded-DNA-specific exonuclease RecJ n=2 Tax=Candidatus Photodesmus anomalopis TaxID=28176 RepID=S3DHG6_9GAMM|nr:single-stranded-DNA-specific exonuclease RecJ [Candidatus Photodesmus katoptron Akat1]